MTLYEIQATEYNGQQEYAISKLLAAETLEKARQTARTYFQDWYDDASCRKDKTADPDVFEFDGGAIQVVIHRIQRTTLDAWVKGQLELHSITALPEEWLITPFAGSATELLEACKELTSYTMDLLYRLDNQVHLDEVEPIQQAKEAIAKYSPHINPNS